MVYHYFILPEEDRIRREIYSQLVTVFEEGASPHPTSEKLCKESHFGDCHDKENNWRPKTTYNLKNNEFQIWSWWKKCGTVIFLAHKASLVWVFMELWQVNNKWQRPQQGWGQNLLTEEQKCTWFFHVQDSLWCFEADPPDFCNCW